MKHPKESDPEKNRPFILLPIETKAREFHAKLLLSCFAAENGFDVVLGDQNEMNRNMKYLPRGIFIDKSIARTKIRSFQKKKKIGNCVVAWCEEGLTFRDPDTYLKERISVDAYNVVEKFFAWGNFHQEILQKTLDPTNNKIVCTGNPRFDLLRRPYRNIFSTQADLISRKYSPFILINTNFSRYNHFYGRDFVIENMKAQGRIINDREESFLVKWADYLGKMYHHFVEMAAHLSQSFPESTIIIRPHPSESQITWKRDTQTLKNVDVIHEGNAISWIMASDVMIHNSCTTGVEAFVMEAPCISYCPITSDIFDSYLPNLVSRRVVSLDEITTVVKEAFEDPTTFVQNERKGNNHNMVAHYIHGLNGRTSCEHIVITLREMVEKYPFLYSRNSVFPDGSISKKLTNWIYSGKNILRRIIKGRKGGLSYQKQKFPGLDLNEVQQAVEAFKTIVNSFGSVNIKKIPKTKSCFLIFKHH